MVCEKNLDKVSGLFIGGRKSNSSIIFISQSFFGIPTQVRINSDYYILTRKFEGKGVNSSCKTLWRYSMSIDNFKEMYRNSTRSGYEFFVRDLQKKDDSYRFRKKF